VADEAELGGAGDVALQAGPVAQQTLGVLPAVLVFVMEQMRQVGVLVPDAEAEQPRLLQRGLDLTAPGLGDVQEDGSGLEEDGHG